MAICIDRCVCFNVPFERLVQIAASTGCTTIEALQEHVELIGGEVSPPTPRETRLGDKPQNGFLFEARFGLACRLCHPYVRRALRTGEVVFCSVLTDDDEPG